jgi:hypothetical protein
MGFNFGAFAGGLAQGGIGTYKMLEDLESQKKRDALIEMQAQEMKQNMADRAAIKELGKDTYGKVGQEDLTGSLTQTAGIGPQQAAMLNTGSGSADFDAYDRQQQAQTLRGNVEYQSRPDVQSRLAQGSEAGLPTTQEQRTALAPALGKYTEDQAAKDYATRLKGIDFEKGLSAEKGLMDIKKGGLELKSLERTAKFNELYDTEQTNWNKTFTDKKMALDKELAMNGPNGVIKSHGAEFERLTGEKLTMDKKGMVILTKDGKETGRFPATEFKDKLDNALKMHYTEGFADHLASKGMFPDAKSAIEYGHKKIELNNQTRTTAAHETSAKASVISANAAASNAATAAQAAADRKPYFAALAKKLGTTKAEEAKEMIEMQANIIQKADPNITREAAEQAAANKLLHSAEDKAAAISNKDIATWIENNNSQLKKTVNGRKISMSPEEKQQEAMRVLTEQRKKLQGGGGIPTGGGTSAATILNSAVSGTTRDPFATE